MSHRLRFFHYLPFWYLYNWINQLKEPQINLELLMLFESNKERLCKKKSEIRACKIEYWCDILDSRLDTKIFIVFCNELIC